MEKFKVVLDQPGELHPVARECLDLFAATEVPATFEEGELIGLLKQADAVMSWGNTKFTEALLSQAGPRLKTIGVTGTGVDNVDLNYTRKRGLVVTNTPGVNATAVAEYTVGAILQCLRHMFEAQDSMRRGHWEIAEVFTGREIKNSTAGVVGLGNIGRQVAGLLRGFGAEVLGYDPLVDEKEAASFGVELMRDLPALCARVDYMSIHVPLIPQTQGLVGRDCLEALRPHAWLVNAGRAPVVDEDLLLGYLKGGQIAGYMTDVFPTEPADFSRELYSLKNVHMTPHIAAMTDAAYRDMQLYAARNIQAVLTGGRPLNIL